MTNDSTIQIFELLGLYRPQSAATLTLYTSESKPVTIKEENIVWKVSQMKRPLAHIWVKTEGKNTNDPSDSHVATISGRKKDLKKLLRGIGCATI